MNQEPCRVIAADPPWQFGDSLGARGSSGHYACLSQADIERGFPMPPIADDAYLFLWRVSSQVEEAYRVVRAWGFTPKTELVWIKKTAKWKSWFGMGRHLRASHETCIVAVKGKPKPLVRNVRSVFEAKAGRHSEKPDEFYEIVERFCPGPRVELFSRKQRPGWICLGNEVEVQPLTEGK